MREGNIFTLCVSPHLVRGEGVPRPGPDIGGGGGTSVRVCDTENLFPS